MKAGQLDDVKEACMDDRELESEHPADQRETLRFLREAVSWSGRYRVFFAEHLVEGHVCYDVGSINLWTGMMTRRHYLGRTELERGTQHAEALRFWDDFREKMLRKPESEGSDGRDESPS